MSDTYNHATWSNFTKEQQEKVTKLRQSAKAAKTKIRLVTVATSDTPVEGEVVEVKDNVGDKFGRGSHKKFRT